MNNNNNPIGMIDSGLGGLSLFSIFERLFRMKTLSISPTRNMSLMETEKATGLFHEPRI